MRRPLSIVLLALVLLPALGQAQTAPTITYPAGSYTLTFPSPVQIVTTDHSVTFTWGVLPPQPLPPTPTPIPPGPTPPIPPKPPVPVATGTIYVTMILDPATITQEQAIGEATLAQSPEWKALDVEWHSYRVGQSAIDALGYGPLVQEKGTPLVIYQAKQAPSDNHAPIIMTQRTCNASVVVSTAKELRKGKS